MDQKGELGCTYEEIDLQTPLRKWLWRAVCIHNFLFGICLVEYFDAEISSRCFQDDVITIQILQPHLFLPGPEMARDAPGKQIFGHHLEASCIELHRVASL